MRNVPKSYIINIYYHQKKQPITRYQQAFWGRWCFLIIKREKDVLLDCICDKQQILRYTLTFLSRPELCQLHLSRHISSISELNIDAYFISCAANKDARHVSTHDLCCRVSEPHAGAFRDAWLQFQMVCLCDNA